MIDFSNEITSIKTCLAPNPVFLELTVKKDWRATVSEHRSLIRHGFLERHAMEITDRVEFLNLDLIPVLNRNFISISHSISEGGYAFSNLPVGFDLIERSRLNEKVLARVSTSKEILAAADPCYLWPAKEAVFKACSDQLSNISEIHIEVWKNLGENLFSFESQFKNKNGVVTTRSGFVFEKSDVLYGLYLVR